MKKFAFAALLALGVIALVAPRPAFAADDEKMFKIHGEVRFRGEYTNNTYDFDSSNDPGSYDDSTGFWPYRVRIAAEGQFSDNVTGWIELQNTGVFGEQGLVPQSIQSSDITNARRFNDGRSLTQMYQAYINLGKLGSEHFNLRIGRQEMVLGNEFIFGDEDFYTGISHDGIVAMWNLKAVDITAWYARTVEDSVYQYGFPSGGAQDLPPDYVVINQNANNIDHFGAYVSFGVGKDKSQDVDVYIVNVNDRGFGGRYQTFGARYGRQGWDKGGLVWNVEYAVQFGDLSSQPANPFTVNESAGGSAGEALIGWNFKGTKSVHRVFGKYELASGDDASTNDKFEGFVPLFGEVHNRTGHGDWFRVQHDPTNLGTNAAQGGLEAWAIGYTGMFNGKHEVGAQYWDYSYETSSYTVGPNNGTDLGNAFDIWYGYNYSKNVTLEASYSNLSPGDALTGGGNNPSDAVERLYGNIRLRF